MSLKVGHNPAGSQATFVRYALPETSGQDQKVSANTSHGKPAKRSSKNDTGPNGPDKPVQGHKPPGTQHTTQAVGEEGGTKGSKPSSAITTKAVGEETGTLAGNGRPHTTLALGEEGGKPIQKPVKTNASDGRNDSPQGPQGITTKALGEETAAWNRTPVNPGSRQRDDVHTTLALGEEGGKLKPISAAAENTEKPVDTLA